MANPLSAPVPRLWLAWYETAFHANITIALRLVRMATDLVTGGTPPVGECWRMVGEKQLAAVEAMAGAWLALPKMDGVKIATAALAPYRRRTRANSRRLSRRAKRQ
jgi:hypothetical protein